MERKKCVVCGKEFKAFNPKYDTCPDCKSGKPAAKTGGANMHGQQSGGYRGGGGGGGQGGQRGREHHSDSRSYDLNESLLLKELFEGDNLKREVFRDIPEQIAQVFDRAGMNSSSVRRFYNVVRRAYDKYRFSEDRNFTTSRELIQSLDHLASYSQTRDVTKPCFTKFIKHYIDLAEKNPENLRGFKMLFESVIGFMPKK